MPYNLAGMRAVTERAIVSLLVEVAQHPLDHFSEKSLQVRLASRLLPAFSEAVETGLRQQYQRHIELLQKQEKRQYDLARALSIPPVQMEYGVNLSGSYRLDIAILDPGEIPQITNWQLQRYIGKDGNKRIWKYLSPYIGIEFGTEKVGWDKMCGSHLANDAEKVSTCRSGFVINVMRNTIWSRPKTGRHDNKVAQVEKFKQAMVEYAGRHPSINWVGLILNVVNHTVDLLLKDKTWKTFDLASELQDYEAAIVEKVKATPETTATPGGTQESPQGAS
jgi:hypothetical protein